MFPSSNLKLTPSTIFSSGFKLNAPAASPTPTPNSPFMDQKKQQSTLKIKQDMTLGKGQTLKKSAPPTLQLGSRTQKLPVVEHSMIPSKQNKQSGDSNELSEGTLPKAGKEVSIGEQVEADINNPNKSKDRSRQLRKTQHEKAEQKLKSAKEEIMKNLIEPVVLAGFEDNLAKHSKNRLQQLEEERKNLIKEKERLQITIQREQAKDASKILVSALQLPKEQGSVKEKQHQQDLIKDYLVPDQFVEYYQTVCEQDQQIKRVAGELLLLRAECERLKVSMRSGGITAKDVDSSLQQEYGQQKLRRSDLQKQYQQLKGAQKEESRASRIGRVSTISRIRQ